MAEVITCPGCQRTLQVPEQFLGQTVQCPECRHVFTAAATAAISPKPLPGPIPERPPPRPPRREDDDYDVPRRRSRYDDEDDFELRRRRRDVDSDFAPHRGGVVLALGLVALVGGMSICLPLLVGPVAWALGTYDLREIREGRMDPSGESMTRTGQVLGIVSTVLMILGSGFAFLLWLSENGF